jgi:putative transposase
VLARQKPRFRYRRLCALLERRGCRASPQRVYRVYSQEHLAVRRLKRKRLVRPAPAGTLLSRANQEWAVDFVADGLATGRGLRMLTVVDSFTRECPGIEVDTRLSSRRVTRVLEWIMSQRGTPEVIRCDNVLNASVFWLLDTHISSIAVVSDRRATPLRRETVRSGLPRTWGPRSA